MEFYSFDLDRYPLILTFKLELDVVMIDLELKMKFIAFLFQKL